MKTQHRLAGPLKYNSCPLTIHLNPVCHKACKKQKSPLYVKMFIISSVSSRHQHRLFEAVSLPARAGRPPLLVGGVSSTDVLVKLVPKTTHETCICISEARFNTDAVSWLYHQLSVKKATKTTATSCTHSKVERIYDAKYFSDTLKQICTSTLGLSLRKCWTI